MERRGEEREPVKDGKEARVKERTVRQIRKSVGIKEQSREGRGKGRGRERERKKESGRARRKGRV